MSMAPPVVPIREKTFRFHKNYEPLNKPVLSLHSEERAAIIKDEFDEDVLVAQFLKHDHHFYVVNQNIIYIQLFIQL